MRVVALVPAFERADSIGATVRALAAVAAVDRVLVVDDGSSDETAAAAARAGAQVLRLPVNRGKGGAVSAGVAAATDAEVFLLIDADLADTAAVADRLLAPVLAGEADLVVGVLPPAAGRGGFGTIKRLAAGGIRRACGAEVAAPLSGQRAIRAELLRALPASESARFGLEVAMTIDVVRAGARLVEVEVPMEHRHTGRSLAGFAHRGRQGRDIVRALWPRLTGRRTRFGLLAGALVLALVAMLVGGGAALPSSRALLPDGADRVVVVGIPNLGLDDLDPARMPRLVALADEGAAAAASVRTRSGRPRTVEAYATLGAGTRVSTSLTADLTLPAGSPFEGGTAADTAARRTGRRPIGALVVPATASAIRNAGSDLSSAPGALGQALRDAGLDTAVINNADEVADDGDNLQHRPAGIALVDVAGAIGRGDVLAEDLLVRDEAEPYGIRADVAAVLAATSDALAAAEVVVVDPGDTTRATSYSGLSSAAAGESARRRAVARADELVGRLAETLDDRTLLLVIGMTPVDRDWALTPMVAWGAGIEPGGLHSPSTKRAGLVTITDVAPTILGALGVAVPDGMIGHELRWRAAPADLDALEHMNDLAGSREHVYYPMAVTFIVVQALAYLLAVVVLSQHAAGRAGPALGWLVLTFAAWPLATFLERAIPGIEALGDGRQALVWVLAGVVALAARRARRHPLAPLSWVCGLTIALLVVDVATGARLQMSSVLGYSPHTAARYTGFGNTAFAVLAACTVVLGAVHIEFAPRRREAVAAVAALFVVVLVADVWPTLGADVGGVLTMVPVFGLTLFVLSGRRISWQVLALAALATVAVLGGVTAIDLLRPADARTHLGRFAASIGDGDSSFATTIARKWNTNVRLFGKTIWTWMVPITAAFVVYVLVIARGWRRLLPPGSALRAGVIGTVLAGVLGWLANDSGVVVGALVFVYLGPYLTLLALHADRGEPEQLAPEPAVGSRQQ